MPKNTQFILASAAMSCFALGLMLKLDRGILSWLGLPEAWMKYAALFDLTLVVMGGGFCSCFTGL